MMATTHAFAGVTLAVSIAFVAPEFAAVAVVAAIIGGLFPDLDVLAEHRRTLHFPVYYSIASVLTTAVAVFQPTTLSVGIAVFFVAAAVHCLMDILGGGAEFRAWENTSKRGVYDHYNGRWIRPRQWIRYDGAPEDLAMASILVIPGLYVFDGHIRTLLFGLLLLSICYTVVRKPLVTVTDRLLAGLPPWIQRRLWRAGRSDEDSLN